MYESARNVLWYWVVNSPLVTVHRKFRNDMCWPSPRIVQGHPNRRDGTLANTKKKRVHDAWASGVSTVTTHHRHDSISSNDTIDDTRR